MELPLLWPFNESDARHKQRADSSNTNILAEPIEPRLSKIAHVIAPFVSDVGAAELGRHTNGSPAYPE